MDRITLSHGSGGKQTNSLIKSLFHKYFNNKILNEMNDSAQFEIPKGRLALTTDSFVVKPRFFNGGDIGKLAICGTVNDIAVSGAKPLYLTCAFIIEEGFMIEELEQIVKSMAVTAKEAGVQIVAGDTKVVERGQVDGLYINTSGIGCVYKNVDIKASNAKPGDVVIVNGTMGDHGISILCQRSGIDIYGDLISDCAPLNSLTDEILRVCPHVHVLRDATRGGVAGVLNEIAESSNVNIELLEALMPVSEEVRGACELLGLEPIYIANEGKLCVVVPEEYSAEVLRVMKEHNLGRNSCIIGEVLKGKEKRVYMKTLTGGTRIVDMPSGELLPRIC
jgi:hydrogenase expression/formation protein HypE